MIRNGQRVVYRNFSVPCFEDKPVELIFDEDPLCPSCVFFLRNDADGGLERAEFKKAAPGRYEITFYNFQTAMETANEVPMPIGKLNGKKLYLSYMIDSFLRKSGKILHLTWYLEQ